MRLRMSSRSSSSVSKPAASEASSSSSSGSTLARTSLTEIANCAGSAGEVLGAVVVGERHVDRALLARARADELLLEARDQAAAAELDELVVALAALERLAVDRALVVDHDEVAARPPRARPSRASRAARAGARARASTRSSSTCGLAPADLEARGSRRASRSGARRSRSRTAAAGPRAAGRRGRASARRSGAIFASPIASAYQPPIELRTASSSTYSRPTRRMKTCGGTLPLRKPGTRVSRASASGGLREALLDLGRGDLGVDADARLGQLGDAGLQGGGHRGRRTIPWRRALPTRLARLVTGPLAFFVAGVLDVRRRVGPLGRAGARRAPARAALAVALPRRERDRRAAAQQRRLRRALRARRRCRRRRASRSRC